MCCPQQPELTLCRMPELKTRSFEACRMAAYMENPGGRRVALLIIGLT
jgi:hypothetical protein